MNPNYNSELDLKMAANQTLEMLLDQVKSSNLNFHLQQSPFAATISIKTSFVKDKAGVSLHPHYHLLSPNSDNKKLVAQISNLKKENSSLREDVEGALGDSETAHNNAQLLENKLGAVTLLNKKLEQENQKLENEASEIRVELEKLKTDKNMLDDRFAYKSQELSQSQKSTKHLKKKIESLEKVIEQLEFENTNLSNNVKQAQDVIEEKETRIHKVISANKSLHSQIVAAKIKPKTTTTSSMPANISTSRIASSVKFLQTDSHHDIPYEITSPLPPIFSSHLCHASKRIQFLSNSLPSLHTIDWVKVTEEDTVRDMAEQALCEQYDRQIENYYNEARDKSRAVREVFDDNLISKLFEENVD